MTANMAHPTDGKELRKGLIRSCTMTRARGNLAGINARIKPNITLMMTEPITRRVLIKISSRNTGSTNISAKLLPTVKGPGMTRSDIFLDKAHHPTIRPITSNQEKKLSAMAGKVDVLDWSFVMLNACIVLGQFVLDGVKYKPLYRINEYDDDEYHD